MEGTVSGGLSLVPEEIKIYNFEPLLNITHGTSEIKENGVRVHAGENAERGINNRKENLEWYGNKTLLGLLIVIFYIFTNMWKSVERMQQWCTFPIFPMQGI